MKYEIDVESPNELRGWSKMPGYYRDLRVVAGMIAELFKDATLMAIRVRKVEDDHS